MTMFRLFKSGLILFACLMVNSAWAAPNLVVKQPIFDFGEVSQGQTVRHSFSFNNDGDESLLIEKVRSSCGCTAALISAKTLAPGEGGEVQATFDSTRFRGAVTKTISLYSNDPRQPVMKLYVKGKVQEVLSVVPAQLNLGQVSSGKTTVVQVTLQNHGDAPLNLDKVQTSSPFLVAKLPAGTLAAGKSTVIDIQLTPNSDQTRFSGYVIIPAQGALKSDLRIPVLASIQK